MRDNVSDRSASRRAARFALVVGLALALAAWTAGTASASPAASTMVTLDDLQARLATGPIDGYLLTTMHGTSPEQIPVRVLAVVEGFTWGKLIMFDSTAPAIQQAGGVAAGMSGSPIYIDDGGTDKIIGAVSYGEDFSLGGTGLATPIEYMAQEQDQYAASSLGTTHVSAAASGSRTVRLATSVLTSSGTVREVVIAPTERAAQAVPSAAGQIVVHPLALAEIGGMPASSGAYKKLAAKLEAAGLTVVPAEKAQAASLTTPALEPGSPCGVLFSTGLYWTGVLGTVTYVDGDTVLAFGHPVLGDEFGWDLGVGAMQVLLTGATVDGTWPSAAAPAKMMTPADAKGTAIEDRSAGVIAKLGDTSAQSSAFPITTTVTVNGAGAPVVDMSDADQWFATTYWPGAGDDYGMEDPGAVGMLVSAGLYHALGSDAGAGSGTTTTTVVAHQPGGAPVTVAHENVWDTDGQFVYLGELAASDAATMVTSLVSDPYDLRHVIIDSVDVTASLSNARRYAGIVDLQLAHALKIGGNDVLVKYYAWGSPDLQTEHVTLTVPKGTSLTGTLAVFSSSAAAEYGGDYYTGASAPAAGPETLAQVAARLAAAGTNGDLAVSYAAGDGSDDYDGSEAESEAAAQTIAHTGLVFSGYVTKQTTRRVTLRAPAEVSYGASVPVAGTVAGATGDVRVAIYRHRVGVPQPTVPQQTVTAVYEDGVASFKAMLPASAHNEIVTAEAGPVSATDLPSAASRKVLVRAKLELDEHRSGRHVVVTARVRPRDAGGAVQFERWSAGRWATVKRVSVAPGGSARVTLGARLATRVRARFVGSALNEPSPWVSGSDR